MPSARRHRAGGCTKRAAPTYRSAFQRDRDWNIHSAAFRRLEHKTQVFVNHQGDMFRTRLVHSIEVAHLAHHRPRDGWPAPWRG